jgi:PRTRC genetic system protein E
MTMFTTLHPLAKAAQLMITITAEGDEQLRVNVTPIPADTKAKAQLPQPLSLLATPTEFDTDFAAAIATWHAPKRSLIQQAQEAAKESAAPAPASAGKPVAKTEKTPKRPTPAKKDAADAKAGGQPAAEQPAAAGEANQQGDVGAGQPGSTTVDDATATTNEQEVAATGERTGHEAALGAEVQLEGATGTEPAELTAALASADAAAPADTQTLNLF